MEFTVTTQDTRTFISVLWYIEKLENTNNCHLYSGDCVHHDLEDNKILDFVADSKEFTFKYNDHTIFFTREIVGDPVFINSRCEAGRYEFIKMKFEEKEGVSNDEYIKIMKKLLLEAREKYDENKRYKVQKDKLMLWSYSDNFWDDIKRINKRKFDTVILDPNIKSDIKKCIDKFLDIDYKKKLESFGINSKLNLIFSGLPGTGKTSLMFSIASMLNKDIATIDFNNKDLNDHNFIIAINKVPKNCVFVLEDVDALYIERDKSNDNRVSFSCILNFMDGVYSNEDLITIITTNHLEKLDKALVRPMRADKIIKFTYCSKYQYETIFSKFFPEKDDLMKELYKMIQRKKFTTAMLQKYLITYLDEPELLKDNIKLFEELIDTSSDKTYNLYT